LVELATLVERCRRRDELAWEALVRRLQSRVYGTALHYLRSPEDARELAQDVFVRLYRHLDTIEFSDEGMFVGWLVQTTRNAAFDRLRQARSRPPRADVPAEEAGLADAQPSPEAATLAEARHDLVHRAMAELSEINREILLLKEIQGLDIKQVAEILHIPLGTVKSRANRARLELARRVLALDPSYGA
jgi:RNA polymerase sigma-70 factor (ECF subfamily)